MRFGNLRRATTSATEHSNPDSLRHVVIEFVIVVAGILVALGVDNWRQGRQETQVMRAHLSALAGEMRSNIETIDRIRDKRWQSKRASLETVIGFLNHPDVPVTDTAALLGAFARSTAAATPWLSDNQFEALQNSGDLRLLQDQELAQAIAGSYAAPEVLFSQVRRIQGNYPSVVNELIPAQLQPELNQLGGYYKGERAPGMVDNDDLNDALERIRSRRGELLLLARNEAAVTVAQWYALARLKANFEATLAMLGESDGTVGAAGEPTSTAKPPRP